MLAFILMLTALSLLPGKAHEPLLIYTEADSGPLQFQDEKGKLSGAAIEIVRAIQAAIGDSSPIHVVPWARGYKALETVPNTMLFSTTRTEERERLFKWVGPIAINSWAFFAKRGSPLRIGSLDDARRVGHIGTYKNDSREQFLVSKGFRNLESVSDNVLNVKKLMAGRIDLLVSTIEGISFTVRKAGFPESGLEQKLVIGRFFLYMAFSLQTSDTVVKEWEKALKKLNEDGSIERIYRRWSLPVPPPRQMFFYRD